MSRISSSPSTTTRRSRPRRCNTVAAAREDRRRRPRAGRRHERAAARPRPRRRSPASRKVLHADAPHSRTASPRTSPRWCWRSPTNYSPHPVAGDRQRQERRAARRGACSTSRRSPTSPGRQRPTRSCGRSTPATRSRRCRSSDAIKVITVRTTGFDPAAATGGSAAGRDASPRRPTAACRSSSASEITKSERPELDRARRSSSRAAAAWARRELQEVLEPLADKLGAAIGASRAAVDAGFVPND